MISCGFKKTIGLFLIAFGIGAILSLILPLWCWLVICGVAIAVFGFSWLFC